MQFHFAFDTKATPDQVVGALTDFTERRPSIWAESLDPAKYEVRERGDTWAVVREGSARPSIWAVERYDWGKPGTVKWEALESDFCQAGSRIELEITPNGQGGSRVEGIWIRKPKGLKGLLLVTTGKMAGPRMITKAWAEALDRYADAEAG